MNSSTKYWVKELEKLNNGVIERPVVTPPDEDGKEFFGLEIRLPNKTYKILWILGDEEGNYSGAVEIQDCKPEKLEIVHEPA